MWHLIVIVTAWQLWSLNHFTEKHRSLDLSLSPSHKISFCKLSFLPSFLPGPNNPGGWRGTSTWLLVPNRPSSQLLLSCHSLMASLTSDFFVLLQAPLQCLYMQTSLEGCSEGFRSAHPGSNSDGKYNPQRQFLLHLILLSPASALVVFKTFWLKTCGKP